MYGQRGFFVAEDGYKRLSKAGDPPDKFDGVVDRVLFFKSLGESTQADDNKNR